MNRLSQIVALFILPSGLLTLACGDDTPTVSSDGAMNSDERTMQVESFLLPAGEVMEFPSEFEIVSEGDVEIAGDIMVTPDREGPFRIISKNGDITISGSMIVLDPEPSGKTTAGHSGTDIEIVNERLSGVIDLTQPIKSTFIAGHGADAPDFTVVFGRLLLSANTGRPGGDVIFRCTRGTIRLPAHHEHVVPLFNPGNGGHGGDIVIDKRRFSMGTDDTTLELVGGAGGASGRLVLDAPMIENMPSIEQLRSDTAWVGNSHGGPGGDAAWDNSDNITGAPSDHSVKYDLTEITLRGGDGGDGGVRGGNGGHAVYHSGRVMNERGDPVADVMVIGGNGGDIFDSPLPVTECHGGDGGGFAVIGNAGWDGSDPDLDGGPLDGGEGGDVYGEGGSGGNVRENVTFLRALGGDGGNTTARQSSVLRAVDVIDAQGFQDFRFGVIGAPGGAGGSRSGGCPGGDGGAFGIVEAAGGEGGSVPIGTTGEGTGGKGGDVWSTGYWRTEQAKGGDGDSPGLGACTAGVLGLPGFGGTGDVIGPAGNEIGIRFNSNECAESGAAYSIQTQCIDNTSGIVTNTIRQWREHGELISPGRFRLQPYPL